MYALTRSSCKQTDAGACRATERTTVVAAGESFAYLIDLRKLAFIMSSNGMLFVLTPSRGAFTNAFENLTYDEVVDKQLYDFGWGRRLSLDEVRLPRNARELPGYERQAPDAPGFGFGEELRDSFRARGLLPPAGGATKSSV